MIQATIKGGELTILKDGQDITSTVNRLTVKQTNDGTTAYVKTDKDEYRVVGAEVVIELGGEADVSDKKTAKTASKGSKRK